uniref:Maturation protein n=1 Tax=Charcot virus TaxID=2707204 RepID=A0A6H0DIJ5_9VIRU|nr:MAG: maturation protein [Charcot virus]
MNLGGPMSVFGFNRPPGTWTAKERDKFFQYVRVNDYERDMRNYVETSRARAYLGKLESIFPEGGLNLYYEEPADPSYPLFMDIPPQTVGENNQPKWKKACRGEIPDIILSSVTSARGNEIISQYRVEEQSSFGQSHRSTPVSGVNISMGAAAVYTRYYAYYRSPKSGDIRLWSSMAGGEVDVPSEVFDSLYTEILAKSNEAIYDLASDIAEARETVDFLKKTILSGIKLIKKLKTLRERMVDPEKEIRDLVQWMKKTGRRSFSRREVPKHMDAAASYWLQYRYAVMPLMYSIQDALKAVRVSDDLMYQKFRAKRTDTSSSNQRLDTTFSLEKVTRYTARIYCRQTVDFAKLSNRFSLFIPTAVWEVVPWSFVIDWFVNVGEAIQALRPFSGETRKFTASISAEIQTIVKTNEVSDGRFLTEDDRYSLNDNIYYLSFDSNFSQYTKRSFIPGDQMVYQQTHQSYRRWLVKEGEYDISISFTDEVLSLVRRIDAVALIFVNLRSLK